MGSFAKHVILTHANLNTTPHLPPPKSPAAASASRTGRRPAVVSAAALLVSAMLEARRPPPPAQAQSWGTRSFIREKYFSPDLSPEDAVARIRQTTEGLHDMRHMLDTMAWRYVMFYIRLKSAYLDADLKNAMTTLPENRRKAYVKVANEVVDNMSELDRYVRSPKAYESYVYYEKTLKSLDDLVALLA
uniref:Photosynthetic NDH subcomplex L 2 n=1 Tax=Cypripedium formosanum TaxID=53042 RepID=A0A0F7GY02_9ASPA